MWNMQIMKTKALQGIIVTITFPDIENAPKLFNIPSCDINLRINNKPRDNLPIIVKLYMSFLIVQCKTLF